MDYVASMEPPSSSAGALKSTSRPNPQLGARWRFSCPPMETHHRDLLHFVLHIIKQCIKTSNQSTSPASISLEMKAAKENVTHPWTPCWKSTFYFFSMINIDKWYYYLIHYYSITGFTALHAIRFKSWKHLSWVGIFENLSLIGSFGASSLPKLLLSTVFIAHFALLHNKTWSLNVIRNWVVEFIKPRCVYFNAMPEVRNSVLWF